MYAVLQQFARDTIVAQTKEQTPLSNKKPPQWQIQITTGDRRGIVFAHIASVPSLVSTDGVLFQTLAKTKPKRLAPGDLQLVQTK